MDLKQPYPTTSIPDGWRVMDRQWVIDKNGLISHTVRIEQLGFSAEPSPKDDTPPDEPVIVTDPS